MALRYCDLPLPIRSPFEHVLSRSDSKLAPKHGREGTHAAIPAFVCYGSYFMTLPKRANSFHSDTAKALNFLLVKVCWGELREHNEQVITVNEVLPFGRHRELSEAKFAQIQNYPH